MASLFSVTNPLNGKTGVFHQLGSKLDYTVCIQNCFIYKYGKDSGKYGKGLYKVPDRSGYGRIGQRRLQMPATIATFTAPDGTVFTIERITHRDPRYYTTSIITAYDEFFADDSKGTKVIDKIAKKASKLTPTAPQTTATPINTSGLIPVYNASQTHIIRYIDPSHP